MNGGYDDGYRNCSCFWGVDPGSFVKLLTQRLHSFEGLKVLDAGCGEGKNAAFLSSLGALVDAIDVSEAAILNGRRQWASLDKITWQVADVRSTVFPSNHYDIVIAYGMLHCLQSETEVKNIIQKLQAATIGAGYNVICAFNDRQQDLRAHPGFKPCLLSHSTFLLAYSSWEKLASSDANLTERHPNNNIEHTHSLTRILARKAK